MSGTFSTCIQLLNQGRRAEAVSHLRCELRHSESNNAASWALLASIADTPFQKTYYLQGVLRLKPGYPWAESELREVRGVLAGRFRGNGWYSSAESEPLQPPGFRATEVALPWLRPGADRAGMSPVARIIYQALTTSASLVLVAAIVLLLTPRLLGSNLLVVLSQSMQPSVPMGSVVVSRPVLPAKVGLGDVITYRALEGFGQEGFVTHRVIGIEDDGPEVLFRTQGDAAEDPDLDLVPGSMILGKVWFVVPIAGFVLAFLRTPLGFAFLVGIPAAAIIGGEVRFVAVTLREGLITDSRRTDLAHGAGEP